MAFPRQRPRRLRSTPALRRLVAQTSLEPRHLVLPMFVADGIAEPRPISSMPGVVQHTRDSLRRAAAAAGRWKEPVDPSSPWWKSLRLRRALVADLFVAGTSTYRQYACGPAPRSRPR